MCVTVDGKQLSRMSSVRYLGLHIDENLSWYIQQTLFREFTLGYFVLIMYVPLPADFLAKIILCFYVTHTGLLRCSADTVICTTFQTFGVASFKVK